MSLSRAGFPWHEADRGEWLGRRGVVVLHSVLRHLPLRRRKDGLAGTPVEHEQISRLGWRDQRRHHARSGVQIDQARLRADVHIP